MRFALFMVAAAMFASGCGRSDSDRVQGYVEGEFVYVASPLAGQLWTLNVARGQEVKAGDSLFALDDTAEKAARDEAERRVVQSKANLEDVRKGKRPSEIESSEAQIAQARASLEFWTSELKRMEELAPTGAASAQELERARSESGQAVHRVTQLQADLETAKLGARSDQIDAVAADVKAQEAALAKAVWDLAQKKQSATAAGLVFDTLFRTGEWVPAGRPVVVVLPPGNIKVRAFVPQARIGSVKIDDAVRVTVDGVNKPFAGKVAFISPQAEFTPPVIYSQESRDKLVFMIEIRFDPKDAAELHPGQPVDVNLKN